MFASGTFSEINPKRLKIFMIMLLLVKIV